MADSKCKGFNSIEIIGAGFGRTGTMSMTKALNMLGYKTYHMEENVKNGDNSKWIECMEQGKSITENIMFPRDYNAIMDFPASAYWRELYKENPNAKVILTVREPSKWYASACSTIWDSRGLEFNRLAWFLPFARRFRRMSKLYRTKIFAPDEENAFDKDLCIKVFERNIKEVKEAIPEEQLLIYTPGDGWEPLCRFLGKDIPEVPYPRSNSKAEFQKRTRTLNTALICIHAALVAAAGFALYKFAL